MQIELKIYSDDERELNINEELVANYIPKLIYSNNIELERSLHYIVNSSATDLIDGIRNVMNSNHSKDDKLSKIYHLFMTNGIDCKNPNED